MCCTGLLKTMMFIFNGAIFLAGAAVLAVGIWVKVDSASFMGALENIEGAPAELGQLVSVAYVLIGVGAALLIIGFLGCCGAVRESRCMLLIFFLIVMIIFIAEVAGAIVLFVFEGLAKELIGSLEEQVRKDIQEKYGENNDLTGIWNTTMNTFKCCGFNNYTDFDGSPFANNNKGQFPTQCCNSTELQGNEVCPEDGAIISDVVGCMEKLIEFIEDNAVLVGAVALGIAALEIAAMTVSMILYRDIGRKA